MPWTREYFVPDRLMQCTAINSLDPPEQNRGDICERNTLLWARIWVRVSEQHKNVIGETATRPGDCCPEMNHNFSWKHFPNDLNEAAAANTTGSPSTDTDESLKTEHEGKKQ